VTPRRNDRSGRSAGHRPGARGHPPARPPEIDDEEDAGIPWAQTADQRRLNVIVSSHAERQLGDLGRPAEQVLAYLREISYDEILWSAQAMPPQNGREVFLLWAGSVRVLFDIEADDLTIQGFGLSPRW
jgi:hypothetical protein